MEILKTNKKNGSNSCKYIMLHHTAMWLDNNWKQAAELLAFWKKEVSVHYVVWKNWTVWKIWEDTDRLWHAWSWSYNWITDMNSNAIWIEVDSDWYNFTKEQFNETVKLIKTLMNKYSIKSSNIIRHADYTTRKWDIWENFFKYCWENIEDFRKLVDKKENIWFYENIFNEKYNWISSVYSDMETAKKNLWDVAFFIALWFERIKK